MSELERLVREVTPGPLRVELDGTGHYCLRAPHQTRRTVARVFCDIDAEFIVTCWDVVPKLLVELRRLQGVEDSL